MGWYPCCCPGDADLYLTGRGASVGNFHVRRVSTTVGNTWDYDLGADATVSSAICADSTEDCYNCDQTNGLVKRFSATGALERTITSSIQTCQGVSVDSSWNIYICGDNGAGGDRVLEKWNSSGVFQWAVTVPYATYTARYYAVDCDASGNTVMAGLTVAGAAYKQLWCNDNAGAEKWSKTGPVSGYLDCAIDTSGYVIAVDGAQYVRKYAIASGTEVTTGGWPLDIVAAGSYAWLKVAIDGSDNVYLGGQTNAPTVTNWRLWKYNSAGTKQWDKVTTAGHNGPIAVNTSGELLFGSATKVYKVEADGSSYSEYYSHGDTVYAVATDPGRAGAFR